MGKITALILLLFTGQAFGLADPGNLKNTVFIIYCILALLFQPFLKVALGRELWNIIDVIVGIGLIISLFIKPKREETKNVKHHSDKL